MKVHLCGNYAYVWTELGILIFRDDEKFEVLVHLNHVTIDIDKSLTSLNCVFFLDQGIDNEIYLLGNIFYQNLFTEFYRKFQMLYEVLIAKV